MGKSKDPETEHRILIGADIPRGEEVAHGKQEMVGVFRNERLIGVFNTQYQAQDSLLGARRNAIKMAHMIEDYGFRYRIVRLRLEVIE